MEAAHGTAHEEEGSGGGKESCVFSKGFGEGLGRSD